MSARQYAKEAAVRRIEEREQRGVCRWCGGAGPFGSVGERERHENDCSFSPLRKSGRRRVA